ncbi:late bloomer [Musca autumnalis]|uniref:late bloomer n=1 Tax=Musca autumnalis TaxID=221902 RepID=UPI003CEA7157
MGCATTTVKISSIAFNIILAIFAIASIIVISFNPDSMREDIAIGAYIACSLIVFFAFLGCFAAIRESVCLTATCAVFLLVLAAVQIALTTVGMSDTGVRSAVETVDKAWESDAMDVIQSEHECCGKVSPNDYVTLHKAIPTSCYIDGDTSKPSNLFYEGCKDKLQQHYEEEVYIFTVISWSLVAFVIIGFLLALFLAISFRNTQRRMQF